MEKCKKDDGKWRAVAAGGCSGGGGAGEQVWEGGARFGHAAQTLAVLGPSMCVAGVMSLHLGLCVRVCVCVWVCGCVYFKVVGQTCAVRSVTSTMPRRRQS